MAILWKNVLFLHNGSLKKQTNKQTRKVKKKGGKGGKGKRREKKEGGKRKLYSNNSIIFASYVFPEYLTYSENCFLRYAIFPVFIHCVTKTSFFHIL